MKLNASDFTVESEDKEILDHKKKKTVNFLEDIGLLKELKRLNLYQKDIYVPESRNLKDVKPRLMNYLTDEKSKILKGYENFSVDVPAGYELFINTFKQMIEADKTKTQILKEVDDSEFLFKVYNEEKKQLLNIFQEKSNPTGEKYSPTSESNEGKFAPLKLFDLGKDLNLAIQPKKKATYYYYKRWLWLIFPWACLSAEEELKYSYVMKKCYSDETKGMRLRDEERLTKKALDISVQAKMKRMMILNSKKRDYLIHSSSLKETQERSRTATGTKGTGRFRSTAGDSAFRKGRSEKSFRNTYSGKFGNRSSKLISQFLPIFFIFLTFLVSTKHLASTTMPEEREEVDGVYLTGVDMKKKKGSTFSEKGLQKVTSLGERGFSSTIQPKVNYFSEYDANLSNKFKMQKYEKNIMRQFSGAKKRHNFKGLLKNLREAFELKSQVEVSMMEKKNTTFMRALNQIVYER